MKTNKSFIHCGENCRINLDNILRVSWTPQDHGDVKVVFTTVNGDFLNYTLDETEFYMLMGGLERAEI